MTDFRSGLVLSVISLVSIGYALSLPQGITNMGVLQPGVFPLFISIGLLIFSIILTIQGLKGKKKQTEGIGQFNMISLLQNKSLLLIAGIFVYFTVVLFLGFLVSTIIAVFISIHFVFKHKLSNSLFITLIISFGTYFIFQSFLNNKLPEGILLTGIIQ
ncbi:tripartite tricarboxylate transporter TctB family protein [Mesobacillus subterraneus]|nr:tripartite tricarboxylate transporter TctB family protein [Mesobacillus subterraneus]